MKNKESSQFNEEKKKNKEEEELKDDHSHHSVSNDSHGSWIEAIPLPIVENDINKNQSSKASSKNESKSENRSRNLEGIKRIFWTIS